MKLTTQEELDGLEKRWQNWCFLLSNEFNREREAAEKRHEAELAELRERCWSKWGGAAGAFGHCLRDVPLHAPVKPVWEARPQFGDNWYVKDQFNNVAADNIHSESIAQQIAEMLNKQEAK